MFNDQLAWLAMCCIMSLNLIAVPLLIYLAILRNRKFDEEKKEENDKEKELVDFQEDNIDIVDNNSDKNN